MTLAASQEPGGSGARAGQPQVSAACDTTAASETTAAPAATAGGPPKLVKSAPGAPEAAAPPNPHVISDNGGQPERGRLAPHGPAPPAAAGGPPQAQQQQQQQQLQLQQAQQAQQPQWLAQVAAQTHHEVRQRMSQAGDQLNLSIRQIYASASSIAAEMPPSYHNIPGIVPYNQGRSIGPPPSYDDVINPYAPPPTYHSLFGQMCEARKRSRGLLDLLSRLFIILVSTLGCTILIAFMILIPFTMIIVGAAYIDECRIEHIPAFLLVGGLVWASKSVLHCYSQCRQLPSGARDLGLDDVYLSASSLTLSSAGSGSSAGGGGGAGESSSDFLEPREAALAAAAAGASMEPPATPGGLDSELHARERRADQNSRPHRPHRHWAHHNRSHHHHHHHHHRHLYDAGDEAASSSRLKSSICESLLNCVLFGWFIAGCVIVFRNYEPDFENPASPCYCHKTVYMYTFWLITSAVLLLGLFVGCICCLIVSSAVASHREDVDDDLA